MNVVTANPLRYVGEIRDTTGLVKLGARYYDPDLGRFTQHDPSGQERRLLTEPAPRRGVSSTSVSA